MVKDSRSEEIGKRVDGFEAPRKVLASHEDLSIVGWEIRRGERHDLYVL
jgi:hypothetical protein